MDAFSHGLRPGFLCAVGCQGGAFDELKVLGWAD